MFFEKIEDQVCDARFGIDGLQFEPNVVQDIVGPSGWFTKKLMSSEGPLISDFVTHEATFRYSTYGIHIGQDDRLTFMGENGSRINGYFVDCREGSPTLHKLVALDFAPGLHRRLVIPRGVAHTFDHLEHIVTRDEPVWYSDENNPAWNIDNDLVSINRHTEPSAFPVVRANKYRLPDEAHQFLSRLSQTLLESPKSYLARFPVKIGGAEQFVMFEPKSWADDERELQALLDVPTIAGVEVRRNRYALTGPKSWTLVPNTAACVADILLLPATVGESTPYHCHARTRKRYTFLNRQGVTIEFDFVDRRGDSSTFGTRSRLRTTCDPRISIAIDHGIAYSVRCREDVLVRCEHEVFVDKNEPRNDIPMFNQDLMSVPAVELGSGLLLPKLRCPDAVVYRMAKLEQKAVSAA
jgi:dTDP-4-dehydrorhamnose 3,5-epimerase-like enzyme